MRIKDTEILVQKEALKGLEVCIIGETKGSINDIESLRLATFKALIQAHKRKDTSIAFCVPQFYKEISLQVASKIMAQEVFRYLKETPTPMLKKILFVLDKDASFKVFKQNVEGYLEYMFKKLGQGPFLTVDGIIDYQNGIVMIERRNPPFGWALPGGFVDYGESVEQAVVREVKEETNLDFVDFKQFGVYSDPKRDPRFHTVGVVFTGIGKGKLAAGDDAKTARIVTAGSLPKEIPFDHRKIIGDYFSV
jgi:8-oxo-dGTP diphosphatase